MRIKEFETNGFGCLKGSYQFGSSPSTLIIEKNEKGKSTFVAGILAALYGLDENGSQGLTERERFRPMKWKGFDVSLTIQIGEREYRIVRDFKAGTVGIWDKRTGQEITSEFKKDNGQVMIGEGLIDLSREGFLKTSLIRQYEIQDLSETSHIAEKIEAMIDSLSGDATVRQAVALLTKARDHYRDNRPVGKEIELLSQQLKDHQREWEALEKERDILDEKVVRLLELGQRSDQLRDSVDRVDYAAMLSKEKALEQRISQSEENKANLKKLQTELESLGDISSFPSGREKELTEGVQARALLNKRIKTLKGDLDQTRKRMGSADKRITEEFKAVESLTEKDYTEISSLMKALQKDLLALPKVRKAYDTEEKLMAQEGYPLKDYFSLKKTVGKITPEEKTDLMRYQKGSEIKKIEIKSLKRDIHVHEEKVAGTEAGLRRRQKSKNRAILFGVFLVLLGAVSYALGTNPLEGMGIEIPVDWLMVQGTVGAIGLLAILWGVLGGHRGRKRNVQALSHSMESFETLLAKKNEIEKQLEEEWAKMEKVALRCGLASPDMLSEELRRFELLEERTIKVRELAAHLREITSRIGQNRSKLAVYMKNAGDNPEKASSAHMVQFYKRLETCRKVRSERNTARDRLTELEGQFQEAQKERKKKGDLIVSILDESQIVWNEDGDKAINEFKEKQQKFHRFVQLRDQLIPQAQGDQIPEDTYKGIVSDLKDIEAAMRKIERRHPEVMTSASQGDPSSDNTMQDKKREMERISEERQGLSNEITQFLEHYREGIATVEKEMEICQRNLEKAAFFEETTELAIHHLESLRSEQHVRWAEFLNQNANTVLSRLNPNCKSVEIKPNLSFSIHHRELQTTLDQTHVNGLLSVGARDQIYLALRLAVSQYLSASGSHLPFILDDALITADDDRFVNTMNFVLKELSERHQVIILTCHEKRHQWWLDHIPKGCKDRIRISRLAPSTSGPRRAEPRRLPASA